MICEDCNFEGSENDFNKESDFEMLEYFGSMVRREWFCWICPNCGSDSVE